MITEFIEVTERPRLQRMIRPLVRDAIVEALRTRCRMVTPATEFPHCRDPKDDIVIATAVAGHADLIVTSDTDLLDDDTLRVALAEYNLRVIYPVEFYKLINEQDM